MDSVWSTYWINSALAALSAILVLLSLNNFVRISGMLCKSISNWRQHIAIEHNLQIARSRNRVFYSLILPLALVADRFSLYPPAYLVPRMWSSLTCLAVFLGYRLVRFSCLSLCNPYRMDQEQKNAMHNVFDNLFCLMLPVMLACVWIMTFSGVDDSTIRTVLLAVMALFIIHDWVTVFHFLVQQRSRFISFLYLCALEIVPLIILVIPALIPWVQIVQTK